MKITCQNEECGTIISIPDEKVPAKPVRIACPKCKSPNIVTPPKAPADEAAPKAAPPREGDLEQTIMNKVEERISSLRNELLGQLQHPTPATGSFTPNETGAIPFAGGTLSKKALICDDDKMACQIINDSVSTLGYEVDEVETIEGALKILDHSELDYSLILIDKVFPDDAEGGYKILSKIATMQIDARRKIFVVFISGEIKSGDPSAAFLSGANIIVNKQDIGQLSTIIENEMADYDKLYKIFRKCLETFKSVRRD
ncbi:MAG: response regulator [Deltaproteobacteria bacterium]|nr:response regulator [Deltaproteobacteria bacterium]